MKVGLLSPLQSPKTYSSYWQPRKAPGLPDPWIFNRFYGGPKA